MALKKLIAKRRGPRPSAANVIIDTLRRFGVSAPIATAAAIVGNLRNNGYDIRKS